MVGLISGIKEKCRPQYEKPPQYALDGGAFQLNACVVRGNVFMRPGCLIKPGGMDESVPLIIKRERAGFSAWQKTAVGTPERAPGTKK